MRNGIAGMFECCEIKKMTTHLQLVCLLVIIVNFITHTSHRNMTTMFKKQTNPDLNPQRRLKFQPKYPKVS